MYRSKLVWVYEIKKSTEVEILQVQAKFDLPGGLILVSVLKGEVAGNIYKYD